VRRRAEEIVAKLAQENANAVRPPEDTAATMHELLVHQIELEMQNEELRRAQAALDASRARYFNLFDMAPVGYVTVSEPGLILECNLAAATLLGRPRGKLIDRPIIRAILPSDQDVFYLMRKALLETGAPQSCELRVVKADSTAVWVRMHASVTRDESPAPVFRISLSDISESRRNDEAMRQSEEKFRTMADFTYDWEYWQGDDGHLIYVSPSCERISGYTRDEFLADPRLVKSIVHPEDAEKFSIHIESVELMDPPVRLGERADSSATSLMHGSNEVEFRIIKKDGSVVHIEHGCQPVFDARGGYQGRRVSNRDVTSRKQVDRLVLENEARLQATLESAADGILAVDNSGRVTHSNRRFAELWRIPPPLVEGGSDKELLDHVTAQLADPGAFIRKVRELYDSDEFSMDALTFKDGRIFERYSLPMIVAGERIGRVWSFRDITAHMQAKEELRKKNAELAEFTNTVSHDLKSPLVTIKTFLGYLKKDLGDPVSLAKDLGYIHGAADKMSSLLDELLALARVGHLGNSSVEVPLQEIVREARRLVAGQIAERGVRVEVTSEPIVLHGDRPRLVEVFQNLLDNAVKFLGDQPEPRIEIGAEQEGGEIVLFVRDNGKGIDPRHKSKLFGLFEKLDPGTPGSGIGLAMVRRIVEIHGGKIHAHSDGPGKGTTFRFTLDKTFLLPSPSKLCIL
jgi:PAS domain S-box-containing protein